MCISSTALFRSSVQWILSNEYYPMKAIYWVLTNESYPPNTIHWIPSSQEIPLDIILTVLIQYSIDYSPINNWLTSCKLQQCAIQRNVLWWGQSFAHTAALCTSRWTDPNGLNEIHLRLFIRPSALIVGSTGVLQKLSIRWKSKVFGIAAF